MSNISGVSHVDLTVSDLESSETWYQNLLGAVRVLNGMNDERGFVFSYLLEPKSRTILGLVQHNAQDGADFSHLRCGLDHLSFAVESRAELEAWLPRLDELEIKHGAIDEQAVGDGVSFQDPDGIALEFYFLRTAVPAS